MKIKNLIILSITATFLSSCIQYYDVQGVNPKLGPTTQESYDNKVKSQARGEACVYNILWLFAVGDSSIETAKKNGNIEDISYVSTNYKHFILYFPFFQKGCTVVYGQQKE